jgi:transcriptional antiterminator NusG
MIAYPEQKEKNVEPKWYAIRTYTGHEQKVKTSLESETKRLEMEDRILDIVIPLETVFEVRNGKRRTRTKNFLPGYILVQVIMDKKVQDVISNLPSVVSFVGRRKEPVALRRDEIERIMCRVEERAEIATIETSFQIGDPVLVIDGPFNTFSGSVIDVKNDKQKLKVEVGILGRKTPVELDFNQVEHQKH